MILLYLLLAHFIADFLLQPSSLIAWKNRSWRGVFLHAGIHFLVTGLLLYLYLGLLQVWLLAFPLATAHFFIDLIKANHQKTGHVGPFGYWLDQTLHYLSILLIFFIALQLNLQPTVEVLKNPLYLTYTSPALIIYLSLAIFSTYTVEYSYFPNRQKYKNHAPPVQAKHMITRLFIVTLIYLGLIFALPVASGLF